MNHRWLATVEDKCHMSTWGDIEPARHSLCGRASTPITRQT